MTASGRSGWIARRLLAAALLAVAGCATSPAAGPNGSGPAPDTALTAPATTSSPSTTVNPTVPTTMPSEPEPGPEWLSVNADYPRYLHHLRRLNLETVNTGPHDLYVSEHVLRADHFEDVAPEHDRLSTVWAGRQVDIQTDFGDVASCEGTGPLRAWVEYRYTTSTDASPTLVRIPIDPAPLDEIRDRECAQQAVWEAVDMRFGEAVRARTSVETSIVLERTGSEDPEVVVESMLGSVIFTMTPDGPLPALTPGDEATSAAVVFDVARCDPHAVGQSTKTYEFNVWVAVGDRAAQAVAIPVHRELRAALDAALAACLADGP